MRIIKFFTLITLGFLLSLFATLVCIKLYTWFLIPFGLPVITFWYMFGIKLFIQTFNMRISNKTESFKEIINNIISYFLSYNLVLFVGYIVHSNFMGK